MNRMKFCTAEITGKCCEQKNSTEKILFETEMFYTEDKFSINGCKSRRRYFSDMQAGQ
jgi:hypothetical protein